MFLGVQMKLKIIDEKLIAHPAVIDLLVLNFFRKFSFLIEQVCERDHISRLQEVIINDM
jgi:hypothetical protein